MARRFVTHRNGLTQHSRLQFEAPFDGEDIEKLRAAFDEASKNTIDARLAEAERWALAVLPNPEWLAGDTEEQIGEILVLMTPKLKIDRLVGLAKPETLEWYAAKVLQSADWARRMIDGGDLRAAAMAAFDLGYAFMLGQAKRGWERPAMTSFAKARALAAGRDTKNAKVKSGTRIRDRAIRQQADEIRARRPDLSDDQVAKNIKKKPAGGTLELPRGVKPVAALSPRRIRAIIALSKVGRAR